MYNDLKYEEKPFLYALSFFPPLFRRWGEWKKFVSLKELFLLPEKELLEIFSYSSIIQEFLVFRRKTSWEKFWEDLIKREIRMVVLEEINYPSLLKEIKNPPLYLLYQGNLEGEKFIAVVGTRRPTSYGIKIARDFARELSSLGFIIVSGLAYGIDTFAHEGALETGKTWAVLGSSLDYIYPKGNQRLAEKIKENGALISEYPLGTKPSYYTFPQRNRIISGISQGVLVVEAGEKSGALITASFALDQGREVFAIPGRLIDEKSFGTNKLIQDGAKMVLEVKDILEEFRIPYLEKKQKINLTSEEEMVLQKLSLDPIFIEDIVKELDISISKLMFILISLQAKGIVEEYPGNRYAVKRSV
ncbi:MAG: DNA-processing protein DprA [Dictyoglomus sp.]|nr:DNA-processing protein DprA [Dictyoglomus sp.]MCX7941608.1 DNA-processing protein DprA [Dictyoglomaceae bacterium]MDW8187773.1 DNA-processing protein DprA [Dictyoglomus sp.]